MTLTDPRGLCDDKNCVPRPIVASWICKVLAANDFNARRAANAAYNLREENNGANSENPVLREGENWLTAAAYDRWYDPQGYVMNIYLWQYLKYVPGGESYSQDALNAGLDGHKHGNSNPDDMKNAEELKKWCKSCEKQ